MQKRKRHEFSRVMNPVFAALSQVQGTKPISEIDFGMRFDCIEEVRKALIMDGYFVPQLSAFTQHWLELFLCGKKRFIHVNELKPCKVIWKKAFDGWTSLFDLSDLPECQPYFHRSDKKHAEFDYYFRVLYTVCSQFKAFIDSDESEKKTGFFIVSPDVAQWIASKPVHDPIKTQYKRMAVKKEIAANVEERQKFLGYGPEQTKNIRVGLNSFKQMDLMNNNPDRKRQF